MSKATVTVVKGGFMPRVSRQFASPFGPKVRLGKQVKGSVLKK